MNLITFSLKYRYMLLRKSVTASFQKSNISTAHGIYVFRNHDWNLVIPLTLHVNAHKASYY